MSNNTHDGNDDFNSITAVENVYPAEVFDLLESMKYEPYSLNEIGFDAQQQAANDAQSNADVFSMSSARRAKHDQAIERRAHKSQLTDRRASLRLDENGEPQPDRRAENRKANIEAIRIANGRCANDTDLDS